MYGITLLLLLCTLLYRQFVLDQPTKEFRDLANIFTFNVIFLFGALFYFGGFPFKRIRPLALVAIYVGFVILGFLFTIFKYTILLDRHLGMDGMLGILRIVSTICGAFVVVYAILAYAGKRKIDKEIE
jgi:hypothetical protein